MDGKTQPFVLEVVGIEPGDFIRAASMSHVTGFVLASRAIKMGRNRELRGYTVRTSSGREDFISEDEAVLVAPSETRWKRLAQELKRKSQEGMGED